MEQTILLLMLTAPFVGGCTPAVPDTAKEESQRPYCNKIFPSGQILIHKLKCPKNHTEITDAGLKEVAKMKQLEGLVLTDTKVTKAGVAQLQKALPKCEISHNAER